MLCYTKLYYTILHYTTVYYTILFYAILYYTTLHYTILHYAVLYDIALHYTSCIHTSPHSSMLKFTTLLCQISNRRLGSEFWEIEREKENAHRAIKKITGEEETTFLQILIMWTSKI